MNAQPFLSELQKIPNNNDSMAEMCQTLHRLTKSPETASLRDVNDVRLLNHKLTQELMNRRSYNLVAMKDKLIKTPFYVDTTLDDFV